MQKSKHGSKRKRKHNVSVQRDSRDYVLQGTALDVPVSRVLALDEEGRRKYVRRLISGFAREVRAERMALKTRVSFKDEMRDLRRLLTLPVDSYLLTDDRNYKRWVLGRGAPGGSHTYWSRKQMWKMKTKAGDLREQILDRSPPLLRSLERLFDPRIKYVPYRERISDSAVKTALLYLQFNMGKGTAFPPFHARFLADLYLPKSGASLVVDPCAGWGGRLLGTLCVPRQDSIRYVGVDPNRNNRAAYEGLTRRITIWLAREISGPRSARVFYQPFEDWIASKTASRLTGTVDLVITSPPYFAAENYDPGSRQQSANRYRTYDEWRDGFYRVLVAGAYQLLKSGGVFVLNIADVPDAPRLERDARTLAREVGFENHGFFKLAMSIVPSAKDHVRHTTYVNGSPYKHEPVFVFKKV